MGSIITIFCDFIRFWIGELSASELDQFLTWELKWRLTKRTNGTWKLMCMFLILCLPRIYLNKVACVFMTKMFVHICLFQVWKKCLGIIHNSILQTFHFLYVYWKKSSQRCLVQNLEYNYKNNGNLFQILFHKSSCEN